MRHSVQMVMARNLKAGKVSVIMKIMGDHSTLCLYNLQLLTTDVLYIVA